MKNSKFLPAGQAGKIKNFTFYTAILIFSFSILHFDCFAADQLTITTYYPSPYGSYNELGTNKLAVSITGVAVSSEYAAMSNGDAHIGRSLIVGAGGGSGFAYNEGATTDDGTVLIKGNVGIGTTNPQTLLDVAGGIKPGAVADSACNSLTAGTIRWHSIDVELQYCDGILWQRIAAKALPATCTPGSTYTTTYKQCSCGTVGSLIWEGTQTCTCAADGLSWSCVPTCPPPPLPCP